MKTITIITVVVAFILLPADLSLSAAEVRDAKRPLRLTRALPADIPPVLDGKLSEPAWQKAVGEDAFLLFSDSKGTELAPVKTSFRVLFDDRCLYLGVTCYEPEPALMVISAKESDKEAWPGGDNIELFLDTDYDKSAYYQFAAGLGGQKYVGKLTTQLKGVKWEAVALVDKDGWSLEMAIPFECLGIKIPPVSGERWGLNVCRNRHGGRPYSSWSHTGAYWHTPAYFGTLIFGEYEKWWSSYSLPAIEGYQERIDKELNKLTGYQGLPDLLHRARQLQEASEQLTSKAGRGTFGNQQRFEAFWVEGEKLLNKYHDIWLEIEVVQALIKYKKMNNH